MRPSIRILFLFVALLVPRLSYGNQIDVGDWVHFNGSLGSLGGGAFLVDDITDPAVPDFRTFCIQESQYIDYTHDFRVGSITDYADDAGGNDPIEPETAWLMSSFSRGALSGYGSDDIQWAIWKLEGEQSVNWGQSAALINLAHLAVLGGWTNDGVKVLNLFWADGTRAQDQLVYVPPPVTTSAVPEPGTIVLLGMGLAAAARRRRGVRRA